MRSASVFDFREGMLHGAHTMTAEEERTRLIGEIARVLRDDPVPDDARAAALTLIGWLARRMPGEGYMMRRASPSWVLPSPKWRTMLSCV